MTRRISWTVAKAPNKRHFHFSFIYESEWEQMKDMIKDTSCILEAERVIPIPAEKNCAFTHVYILDFIVPEQVDIRDICQTYYEIRACYDEELFKEDFQILQSI